MTKMILFYEGRAVDTMDRDALTGLVTELYAENERLRGELTQRKMTQFDHFKRFRDLLKEAGRKPSDFFNLEELEWKGETRRAEWQGGVYMIRDVWAAPPPGQKLLRCEYATKDENGNTIWQPCREGVMFSEIEPFEKAA